MSVLVVDLEVYKAVYEKALSYTFNKQVDINYCSTLGRLTEKEIKSIVTDWLYLNEYSYNRKYEEGNVLPELHNFLQFKSKHSTINTYQMLKYLNCIIYNIELSTIEHGQRKEDIKIEIPENLMISYNILVKAIDEIKMQIISEMPKYKAAKWSRI